MEWIKKNSFWMLLIGNMCLGIFWNRLFFFVAFIFIWLNYMFTSDMKRMLILDVVLLVATQAGAWYEYYEWLQNTETIDIGASIMQLINILCFLAHGFFILAMMTWSFIQKKRKVAAYITGSFTLIGILFFASLAVIVF